MRNNEGFHSIVLIDYQWFKYSQKDSNETIKSASDKDKWISIQL